MSFDDVKGIIASIEESLDALDVIIANLRSELLNKIEELKELDIGINIDELVEFLKEPYCILPKKKDQYWVIVPKFVDFYVGWLEHETRTFRIFAINRYIQWLTGLPKGIMDKLKFEERPPFKVFDGVLLTGREHQKEAWERYRDFLVKRVGEDRIKIKRGYEFQLIAKLIEDGILPFIPRPVEESDLRSWDGIRLRDYQEEAWKKFVETGAVGLFYPFGAGKSFFGLYALGRIKGKKLVVVPTLTLAEQWKERIDRYIPEFRDEVDIYTYHSYHKVKNNSYILTIFDEVHHLPAPTFIRLSTLKRKYTIGLSGSPFREDGKENYIFALTGFPLGVDWKRFIDRGIVAKPKAIVYVAEREKDKIRKLDELLKIPVKTIIFCDSIELGEKLSDRFQIPFVYGKTKKDRLDIIDSSTHVIVSRVGDEGISLPDVERVIEVDFLYGCYDEKTEVLTVNGWKPFSQITFDDEIATLNSNGFIEYQKPTDIQCYPYKGKLIHFKGKNYDILVTPNHRMYVRNCRGKGNFVFKEAREFLKYSSKFGPRDYELKKDAKWVGIDNNWINISPLEPTEYIKKRISIYRKVWEYHNRGLSKREISDKLGISWWTVHDYLKGLNPMNRMWRTRKMDKLPAIPLLQLAGWYVSEGSISNIRSVKITQRNEENREKIKRIIQNLGMKSSENEDGIFIHNKQLSQYFKREFGGGAKNKKLPFWIKQLSPRLLNYFIDAMMEGDGRWVSDGCGVYYTSSKRLADDFQEIAIKAGYATTLTVRERWKKGGFSEKKYYSKMYEICISKNNKTPQISKPVSLVDYDGFVYCVTVPNGVIMIRRNGRAVWCGNSRMQESQRFGRLMHSQKRDPQHIILMTDEEFEKYEKRLYAITERGIGLRIERI